MRSIDLLSLKSSSVYGDASVLRCFHQFYCCTACANSDYSISHWVKGGDRLLFALWWKAEAVPSSWTYT
jgi:hypothetical protein